MHTNSKHLRIQASSYNKIFFESLKTLNDEQRQAVDAIEGPVMVLAGPGTGKTHILASRIGNILMQTDTQAHNILCLTYTEAGTIAMRQRLLQIIGPEAHRVHIFTYHSFCSYVIKSHPEQFGGKKLEVLSKLERTDLVRSLLDELPATHVLVKSNAYFYENHLVNLFDLIKKENWIVAEMPEAIDIYLNSLHENPEYFYKRQTGPFQKGDFKQNKYNDELEKMNLLREAIPLFPIYQQKLAEANRFDFNDMIAWVIKAFEENENLLRNYQEQYQYFLVDEFQDTNGAQNHILKKLITFWENPNVFIVGDDDQAIFEFQGARLQSFVDFYKQYIEELELVILKKNYRSTQLVLDSARALIQTNDLRIINVLADLGVDKNLIAANKKNQNTGKKPKIIQYETDLAEISDIVNQIENAHKNGENLKNIAVLYAQARQADEFLSIFEKKGIPYNTRRNINILKEPIIQQVIAVIDYIAHELRMNSNSNGLLFKILHFRCWKIPSSQIARLTILMRQQEQTSWRAALANPDFLAQFQVENLDALNQAMLFLSECIESVYEVSLPNLIEKIINKSGILAQVIDSPYGEHQVQLLKTFFDFVQQESSKEIAFDLLALQETITKMLDSGIVLDVQRNFGGNEGVFFSTVHSAKGLEFERVFMIGCDTDTWDKAKGNALDNFSLPNTLTKTEELDFLEARRRLFYVGMTRAKKELYISFSDFQKGKNQVPSLFINELMNSETVDFEQRKIAKNELFNTSLSSLNDEKVLLPNQKEAFIDEKLQDFTLSASALITYLDCSLSFYFENIIGVPAQKSEFALFGEILHKTLQVFFDRCVFSNKKQLLGAEILIAIFKKEMEANRFAFSFKNYQNRLENGENDLRFFHEKAMSEWSFNGQTEVYISKTEINGVPVRGVIDKIIYKDDGSLAIFDYKSNKYVAKKLSKSNESVHSDGTYRQQLLFYTLLYQNWRNATRTVSETHITYLLPDFQGKFTTKTITFDEKELQGMETLIKEVYDRIMQQDFYKGCGKKTCQWCQFVKNQVLPESTYNELIGEIDD